MQTFDNNFVRNSYVTENFSLSLTLGKSHTQIRMEMLNPTIINTSSLPHTFPLLKKHFPSVLYTKCFNYNNLPFSQEVRRTEIGHLFEHILIENLCLDKLSFGLGNAVYNGRTHWNWVKEIRGIFHIVVDAGIKDATILSTSLLKSINLTELILNADRLSYQPSWPLHLSIHEPYL